MNQSREISTSQLGPHENLSEVVKKHLLHTFKKPIQQHNQEAFEVFMQARERLALGEIVLDSCCGTGLSSYKLAIENPEKLVIGIDQSLSRLNREAEHLQNLPANCLLLRANCEDFWRLCVDHQVVFQKHSILYPNPYPKAKHLQRRWHGHASFPLLKALSYEIEVRSNWLIYVQEFAEAWAILAGEKGVVAGIKGLNPMTLFEKKYAESGQLLWGFSNSDFYFEDYP